jgi:hypothetical protein
MVKIPQKLANLIQEKKREVGGTDLPYLLYMVMGSLSNAKIDEMKVSIIDIATAIQVGYEIRTELKAGDIVRYITLSGERELREISHIRYRVNGEAVAHFTNGGAIEVGRLTLVAKAENTENMKKAQAVVDAKATGGFVSASSIGSPFKF